METRVRHSAVGLLMKLQVFTPSQPLSVAALTKLMYQMLYLFALQCATLSLGLELCKIPLLHLPNAIPRICVLPCRCNCIRI